MDEADFREVWELADEAELDILEEIASAISDNARKDRAGWMIGLTALLMGIQRRGEKFARDLAPATYRGMYRGFFRSNLQSFDAVTPTESALEAAESLLSPFYDRAAQMATEQAFGASRALEGYFDRLTAGMRASASSAYIRELETVSTRAQQIGYEDALAESVHRLSQQGITASTYVRRDGTVVNVPVDVGLRRSILDEARNRQRAQILDIAAETTGLVEVSITPNARPSHAQWQGEVYTLDKEDDRYPYFNDACHVGDPVDGFGGYNCGHEVAAYLEGQERIFSDPLEGTGYTPEEATDAVTQQRALERQVRAAKREVEMLQAEGADVAQARAKLAGAQQRLKEHVDANAAVLKREPWREGVRKGYRQSEYERAYRMSATESRVNLYDNIPAPRPLSGEEYSSLVSLAETAGVKLDPIFENAKVDFKAVELMLKSAKDVIERFPILEKVQGHGIVIQLESLQQNIGTFAKSLRGKPWIIQLDRAAFKDLDTLEKEYARRGEYVKGTTAKAIMYHELGHLLAFNLGKDEVLEKALSTINVPRSLVGKYLKDNLSHYSARIEEAGVIEKGAIVRKNRYNINKSDHYDELFAEAFAAHMSGVNNPVAEAIIEKVLGTL